MNKFLTLAFLFFIGSVAGWVIELIFRRFFSAANPERKWINPGFCVGPYVPLYGFGLCFLYIIASLEDVSAIQNPILNRAVLFLSMAFTMTLIEYIAGIMSIKITHVRLWDYSKEWGNIQGIICPRFSAAWALLGAVYYFLIHSHILKALEWLSDNLAFSFVVGMFYGVFIIDFVYSAHLISKIKQFAEENGIVVRYEHLRAYVRDFHKKTSQRVHFFFPLSSSISLGELLRQYRDGMNEIRKKIKEPKASSRRTRH